MNSYDFYLLALQFAAMLAFAVFFGEAMRKFGQPAVLGEMLAGIVLGPTIFGALFPSLYNGLFLASPTAGVIREASVKLGMLFFLFLAGLEVNLSSIRLIARKATMIGLTGTLLPLGIGVGLVYLLPHKFWGSVTNGHFFSFALFVGMNLANSANPVIARILMDLGLLKEETGTIVMTATIFDDLINWTLFAIILRDIVPAAGGVIRLPVNIGMVLIFFVFILGVGRWLAFRTIPWLLEHVSWPVGVMSVIISAILFVGSIAEFLGINAFLGVFLLGAALGGIGKEENQARVTTRHFVLSFFAPLYFVSMGLSANFISNFDFVLVLTIILVACVSKIGAVLLGARLAGMPLDRRTLAIAFGLNARGATGIILAGVGFQYGVIDERIFVAMIVMAIVTTLLSAPMIKYLLVKPSTI
jgi:Kef-type K+ transport system membrane component KefB